MTNILTHTLDSYTIGYSSVLTDQQTQQLLSVVNIPAGDAESVLGGRRMVNIFEMADIGSVAVKHYTRGGWVYFFIKDRYLKWGNIRSRIEFAWLQKVRRLGVSAPEPLAFVSEGKLFYKCWLVTREITHHQTLAQLSLMDERHAQQLMPRIVDQVNILIQNRILHVDLHPGNVLIDRSGRTFIIDFDRAHIYSGEKNRLRDRYVRRWKRAVNKHHLSQLLDSSFEGGLNDN